MKECQASDLDQRREAVQRAIAWQARMDNADTRVIQENLNFLGRALRGVRREQKRSLQDVADRGAIPVMLLCFLESGMGTVEEFAAHIDGWANALGQDMELCQQFIPSLESGTPTVPKEPNHE